MSLLEREDALTALDDAVELADGGRGGVVIVSGEAGVGKTSLVRAFLDRLDPDADRWFGACDDLSTPRPLGPFADMARDGADALSVTTDAREPIIDGALGAMRDRRIVMVIDDVQWADDATLDVIASIGRRIADLRGVLVLSFRSDGIADDHPLHRVLARLGGRHTVRLELQPLSIRALEVLIEEAGSAVEPQAVMAATGGNPFYATALLRWSGDGVPPSVRDVALARRRELPEATQDAIDQLSVIPGDVGPDLLAALGIGADEVEHAERAGLLSSTGTGTSFRHQLTRAALADALTAGRRRRLHGRVLEAMTELDAQPARLVHHAVGADDGPQIVAHGVRALDAAVRAGAHREVVAHARTVLAHPGLLDRPTTFRLRLQAATSSLASSRFIEAADLAAAAEGTAGTDLERGQARTAIARAQLMSGAAGPARASAERAIAVLDPLGDTPETMQAAGLLAQLCAAQDDFDAGARWSRRAAELADRLGDEEAGALARTYLGLCRLGLGDETGLGEIERALADAETAGHVSAWRIANNLGVVLMRWGRLADAEQVLARSAALAAESGSDFARIHTGTQIAVTLVHRGEWSDAERRLRALLSRGAEGVTLAPLLGALGRVLARRGDDEARLHIERAWRIATASGESNRLAAAGSAMLELAWIEGDDSRAARLAAQLASHATAAGHHYLAAEACRYAARVGTTITWTPPASTPALDAFDAGLRGDRLLAAQRWSAAGQPYEQALELTEADDAADANHGLALLDELGATATAARVRRTLREQGRRSIRRGPHPTTREHPLGLTRRQSEVLDLIGDGLTNAQIADRLFVSVRTVDHHVSALLARLGASTRAEAVALADHHGERGDGHDDPTSG